MLTVKSYKLLITFVFIVLIICFVFIANKKKYDTYIFYSMDTFFEIRIQKSSISDEIFKDTVKVTQNIDNKLNRYNEKSEISEINRNGYNKKVRVSPETINILEKAIFYSKITDGYFDVTFEPLQNLYGFNENLKLVPNEEDIEKNKIFVDYRYIKIDREKNDVNLLKDGTIINLSAILKGYTLDKVSEYLTKKNIKEFYLNFGGNLLICQPYIETVGIKHPREDRIISKISLKNSAVSTSADYQQFFEKNGIRYTHIINPKTGGANFSIQSVTVVSKKGIDSDFLSTSIFILGEDFGRKIIDSNFPDSGFVIIKNGRIGYAYNILIK